MSKSKQGEFYFDDCPICQANKRAEEEGRELGLAELTAAFEEAEKQGAVVGTINGRPVIGSGPTGRGGSA